MARPQYVSCESSAVMWLGIRTCLVAVALFAGLCCSLDDHSDAHSTLTRLSGNAFVDALPRYPPCSRDCFANGLANLNCSDSSCVCSNKEFQQQARVCVKKVCNAADTLVTKSLTDTACGRRHRDKTSKFVALNIAMGSITCFVILIRLGFKRMKRRIGIDDWTVFAALILLVPLIVLKVRGLAFHGLGKDVWTLQRETLTHFMVFFYIDELFYITIIALVKAAISFFYLSIFRFTRIRLILWAIVIFNAVFGIASLLAIAFQCSPVSYYWNFIVEPGTGRCFNSQAAAWAHGAISIAINLCLIALALSQVIGLELHWKKKLGVIFMFSVGGFDTVVSILRLRYLVYFANSLNVTWDQFDVACMSSVEIYVGLICTCLPTLRLVLVDLASCIFGTEKGFSSDSTVGGSSQHTILMQSKIHKPSTADSITA